MKKLIAVPRTLFTVLVGFVSTVASAITVIVVSARNPASPVIDRVVTRWARSWLWAAGCTLEVTGAEVVDRARSHIVISNHLSTLDIMACFAAIPLPIRFLAKKELFRIPLLASAMRAIGIVEVDRQARSAAIESVNRQSATVIERGHSLIIYPEGTRSTDGELREFKRGAFRMAVDTGMPLLPVTIHGTREAWIPHRFEVHPQLIRVIIDPTIPVEGRTREDVGALREEAEGLIRRRYNELRETSGRRAAS